MRVTISQSQFRPDTRLPLLMKALPIISLRSGPMLLISGLAFFSPVTTAAGFNYEALGWTPRDQLPPEHQERLPAFCRGDYLSPVITPLDSDRIEATADEGELVLNGGMTLSGNVEFQQKQQLLTSDEAFWEAESRRANFRGNVVVRTPDLTLSGDQADFDEAGGELNIRDSAYVISERHLRGTAAAIQTPAEGRLELQQATLTFCEPGKNDWDIAASELTLDQDSGFGTAWHTRLRIREVPVFYIPYYRFPIDDRRLTGFLDPTIAINGMGQAEDIQLPFYLNLAPNLDATITPHHVLDHGLLWENQLRHKTRLLGEGELNYGYLGNDEELEDERWLINYQQAGTFGSRWSHSWVYNRVSDEDYFSDMNPSAAVDRTTHLPSRAQINYKASQVSFTALAESFQTIDETIALVNRPYRRLPQATISLTPDTGDSWTFSQTLQTTRFARKSEETINGSTQTLSGFEALNGDRLLSDTAIAYPMTWPFGNLTPKAEYRYRSYRLYDEDVDSVDLAPDFGAARLSLDGTLVFEREFTALQQGYTQTLEPRLFYVHSPYVSGQNDVPGFDTKATSVTFSNLFTGDRFTGGDRLADLNQISAGVTTRFIRDDGLEQFRASAGRIWYFEDRRVTLNETETEFLGRATSSTLAEAEWNPMADWSVFSFIEWDPYQDYARQQRYGVRYGDDSNHMLSISSTEVNYRDSDSDVDYNTKQLDAGAFWALNDHWALFGRQLRDLKSYSDDEPQPEDQVLELLAGLEYQSCCWRAQFMYRETSPRSSGEFTTEKRFGWMLSIQLKGLTTLGSGTDQLLGESIYGYTRRRYHDF